MHFKQKAWNQCTVITSVTSHFPDGSCVNDDSTVDSDGYTCSESDEYYNDHPEECGDFDTATFNASVQCCACVGKLFNVYYLQ